MQKAIALLQRGEKKLIHVGKSAGYDSEGPQTLAHLLLLLSVFLRAEKEVATRGGLVGFLV
jgi:hypothetical protein